MIRIGFASVALDLSIGALIALVPNASARADCANWDVSGRWVLDQNNGYWVTLDIDQTGNQLTGGVKFVTKKGIGYKGLFYSIPPAFLVGEGQIEGNVNGNAITIIAHWKGGGTVGEYTGSISPQGWLEGDTRDRMHPESTARWSSLDRNADCMDVAAPAPPQPQAPPNKPVKFLGKIKRTVTDLGNGETEYTYPTVKTSSGTEVALDWCRVWANDCGKGAADVFCRQAGHQGAARFVRFDGMKKTWVIDDKKECDGPCASFKSIVCTKVAASGAEYATAITSATIYVEPGGAAFKDANGDDAAMNVGDKARVLEKRTNPVWYRLQTKPVGWVWGDDVTLGP